MSNIGATQASLSQRNSLMMTLILQQFH